MEPFSSTIRPARAKQSHQGVYIVWWVNVRNIKHFGGEDRPILPEKKQEFSLFITPELDTTMISQLTLIQQDMTWYSPGLGSGVVQPGCTPPRVWGVREVRASGPSGIDAIRVQGT